MSQVYAVSLFVEADKAAKELGVRERGEIPTEDPCHGSSHRDAVRPPAAQQLQLTQALAWHAQDNAGVEPLNSHVPCVCHAGGFFQDAPDSDYALAVIDGAFTKALVIHLVRKVPVLDSRGICVS